ncbi:MAG: hypothetical protein PHP13_02255 [Methanomicrobium sp.]|nr:hypothetical protein [Methanomicrobium sp.]
MKKGIVIALLLLISCIIPAVSADKDGQYSYIEVQNISLELTKDKAVYDINYSIDDGIQFLVVLLGKSDLKSKIISLMNFESCRFDVLDMDHARIVVDKPSIDNGDGSLWYPRKEIRAVVPEIVVKTPRATRSLSNTREIPGMGYFAEKNT